MIVKGTKQLGSFRKGINLYVPKKNVPQIEQIIWKIAIFGAGSSEFNGEYIWDGTSFVNGKPRYDGDNYIIEWNGNYWILHFPNSEEVYTSPDLITWSRPIGGGENPPPSSVLSYSQNSYVQTISIDLIPDQEGFVFDGIYTATSSAATAYIKDNQYYINKGNGTVWYVGENTDVGDIGPFGENLFNLNYNNNVVIAKITGLTYST